MRQRLTLTFLLLALLPYVAKAQWTFDIVSVEAYINDHKKQRSLLLATFHPGIQQQAAARVQQGRYRGIQGAERGP